MEDLDLEDAERSELGGEQTPHPPGGRRNNPGPRATSWRTRVCGRGARGLCLAHTNLSKGVQALAHWVSDKDEAAPCLGPAKPPAGRLGNPTPSLGALLLLKAEAPWLIGRPALSFSSTPLERHLKMTPPPPPPLSPAHGGDSKLRIPSSRLQPGDQGQVEGRGPGSQCGPHAHSPTPSGHTGYQSASDQLEKPQELVLFYVSKPPSGLSLDPHPALQRESPGLSEDASFLHLPGPSIRKALAGWTPGAKSSDWTEYFLLPLKKRKQP